MTHKKEERERELMSIALSIPSKQGDGTKAEKDETIYIYFCLLYGSYSNY